MRRRLQAAGELLLVELRRGDRTLAEVEEDELAAVVYRYSQAAQEGAARLNLRLMAAVIAGQAFRGNLVADEFLYYADVLASLRREEIILVAALWRHANSPEVVALQEAERARTAESAARCELVPLLFATDAEFVATEGALMRTGLITAVSGFGALLFATTPLLARLQALAPFEMALAEEAEARSSN